MVQNGLSSGRPLGFDPDRAVAAAMELFWEKGYDRVGVAELEQCTGLNRSSLYNTFGSKEEFFALALQRYASDKGAQMLGFLINGRRGLDDIQAFIDAVVEHLGTLRGRGCFMVNTMAACHGDSDVIATQANHYVEKFLGAMRCVLHRAVALGEIPAGRVESAANLLLGVVLGVNLLARANQPPRRIRKVLNATLEHLRSRT